MGVCVHIYVCSIVITFIFLFVSIPEVILVNLRKAFYAFTHLRIYAFYTIDTFPKSDLLLLHPAFIAVGCPGPLHSCALAYCHRVTTICIQSHRVNHIWLMRYSYNFKNPSSVHKLLSNEATTAWRRPFNAQWAWIPDKVQILNCN